MALFVCFDDSAHDPVYTHAEEAYLVDSSYQGDENPCSLSNSSASVSVLPSSVEEAALYAELLGWKVEYDQNNQLIIHTGLYKK